MGGFFFSTTQMRTQALALFVVLLCGITTCSFGEYHVHNIERTVPPGASDMFNPGPPDFITAIDTDMAMTHFIIAILDTFGNPLDRSQIYLHHLVITSPTVRNLACPEVGGDGHIWAAGAELTPYNGLPEPFAFKIRPSETDWFTRVHTVNPTNQTMNYVIQYTIGLTPWTDDMVQVEGWYASFTGCDGFEFNEIDIPYNPDEPNYVLNLDFPCAFDGIMLGGGGHTHYGGMDIFLSRPESGQIVYSIRPEYGSREHRDWVTAVDSYLHPWRMKMHEAMRITAVFNASNPDSDGNMGIMSGYAIVDKLYDGSNGPLKRATSNKNYLRFGNDEPVCDCEFDFPWVTAGLVMFGVVSLAVSVTMATCALVMYFFRRSRRFSDSYEVEMSEEPIN